MINLNSEENIFLYFYHRPFPLLLGAVYKVQNMVSSTIGDTESEEIKFFKGDDLVRMLGYYWHLIMAADSTIRPGLEVYGRIFFRYETKFLGHGN